jgi:hypothetical protein
LELGPCIGQEAVQMVAAGYGVRVPAENQTAWGEVAPGGYVRMAIFEHFGLRLDAALGIPLRRQEITLIPYGAIHKVPGVTTRAGLGIDFRF